MNHEIKVSNNTKSKIKINLENLKDKDKNNNSYSRHMSKSIRRSSSNNAKSLHAKRDSRAGSLTLGISNDKEENTDLKKEIEFIWVAGFITLIANLQTRMLHPFDGADSELKEVDFVKVQINKYIEGKLKEFEEE